MTASSSTETSGDALLALDVGTSIVKAGIRSPQRGSWQRAEGRLAAGSGERLGGLTGDHLLGAVGDVVSDLGSRVSEVSRVVVTGQMGSYLWVDPQGRVTSPVVEWSDTRDAAVQAQLQAEVAAYGFYSTTGQRVPLLPARIRWATSDMGWSGFPVPLRHWLNWLLTGLWTIDYTDASVTGCFDVTRRTWAADLCARLDVDVTRLPPIRTPGETLGEVSGSYASGLGLPSSAVVHVGAGDGPCASLGAGAGTVGSACLTLGSSGTVRIFTDAPVFDPQGCFTCLAFDDERWIVSAPVSNVGFALDWARHSLGFADADSFDDAAASGRTDPDLTFLPFLNGERFPYWDAGRTAGFHGLRAAHSRADLARAVVLGIAYPLTRCLRYLAEVGLVADSVAVNGGAKRCRSLLQALAELSGVTMTVTDGEPIDGAASLVLPHTATTASILASVEAPTSSPKAIQAGYERFLELADAV
ncbi:MAG: FGGY family carbohydrate kinase [Acidimicrobiales bacterium]